MAVPQALSGFGQKELSRGQTGANGVTPYGQTRALALPALPGQEDVNDAADAMFDAWETRLGDELSPLPAECSYHLTNG